MMNVEYIKIEDLKPYDNNSAIHPEGQICDLVKSLKEFGFVKPIVVDEKNTILAGHGIVAAAGKIGENEIPCVRRIGLSQAQKRAYVLADNKISENKKWDDELVAIELESIQDAGFDIYSLGFDEQEINNVINLPEVITEKTEQIKPINYTRILISIPTNAVPDWLNESLMRIELIGGDVDYGGN